MPVNRRTAIVRFVLPSAAPGERLGLDVEREYGVLVEIDERNCTASRFRSPFGDERWRETIRRIRQCTAERDDRNSRTAGFVTAAGRDLYTALLALCPELADFLTRETGPRRLVIASERPEIHALPWEAMAGDRLQSIAAGDVSVVHCRDRFILKPDLAPPRLVFQGVFGPGIEKTTLGALEKADAVIAAPGKVGLAIAEDGEAAQVLHIEAHGDRETGRITLDTGEIDALRLGERFQNCRMALLWSCDSAMIQTWGDSPASALHRAGNTLVAAFLSPLNYESATAISERFYSAVFGRNGSMDPESSAVQVRAELFKNQHPFCDWASLTIWLRQPLDLSGVPAGARCIPKKDWCSERARPVSGPLQRALSDRLAPGCLLLIEGETVAAPLDPHLVEHWNGPVVHLAGRNSLADDEALLEAGVDAEDIRDRHPAERFLALIDRLEKYPSALLLWTGIGSREASMVETMAVTPGNVGIVLVSPYRLPAAGPKFVRIVSDAGAGEEPQDLGPGLSAVMEGADRERWTDALAIFKTIDAGTLTGAGTEFWQAVYWCAIRSGDQAEAQGSLARLEKLDTVEKLLLDGNFKSRQGQRREARENYLLAVDRAATSRDAARARLELGYVAAESGERSLALAYYRDALEGLDRAPRGDRDTRWNSALARVFRDGADSLADEPGGAAREKAGKWLRLALAIHAFHGRRTQVAYCMLTAAKLASRLGDFGSAEERSAAAAVIFEDHHNWHGWNLAIDRLVEALCSRNRQEQACAVLDLAAAKLLESAWQHLSEAKARGYRANNKLAAARVQWQLGRFGDAAVNAREALQFLPEDRPADRSAADLLCRFLTNHVPRAEAAGKVAVLAGRRIDAAGPEPARFPLKHRGLARTRILEALRAEQAATLICSAACGADLLALDAADELGIRRRVVLPCPADRFGESSVTDRPGEWGPLFERMIGKAEDVIVLGDTATEESFTAANLRILEEAATAAPKLAFIVWDGVPRSRDDVTYHFLRNARARGFGIREISTL